MHASVITRRNLQERIQPQQRGEMGAHAAGEDMDFPGGAPTLSSSPTVLLV